MVVRPVGDVLCDKTAVLEWSFTEGSRRRACAVITLSNVVICHTREVDGLTQQRRSAP